MTKEEELRINATIGELMLAEQRAVGRCADLAADLAVARAEIVALKTPASEPTLKAVE